MQVRQFLGAGDQPFSVDLVLFVMRLDAGCAFILHGWGKMLKLLRTRAFSAMGNVLLSY